MLMVFILVICLLVAMNLFGIEFNALLISLVLMYRLMNSVADVQRAIQETAQSESNYWSLQATINEANEAAETFTGTAEPSLKKSCRLENITFSYGIKPVLTNVSLEIPAGRITTLIGESGSGKTTIADLILGLFVPDQGRVTLDDVPLYNIDIAKWRTLIGYVPQEVLLFNDTIFANIALGDPNVTESDAVAALHAAGAAEFALAQPNGIRATVGEYGAKLSGGQRQRIALARALVHRPTLLILDEATSALDPQTEADICATVRQQVGTMTVLAITHQPAWVEAADRVYRVIDGRVESAEDHRTELAGASAH
jgi:ATP-binding cassette subfamily C protein